MSNFYEPFDNSFPRDSHSLSDENGHHEHSEDCGCGHEHHEHHDHHHEHTEDCGHDHSHDDLYAANGEEPTVFSHSIPVKFSKETSGKALTSALTACVESLQKWTAQNKYLVGHIKLFVEGKDGANLWLASTGKRVNIKGTADWEDSILSSCTIHMTAIIFGPDLKTLEKTVWDYLDKQDIVA
ncbi:MAG: hypothetical protein QHH06_03135 [Clostridiales bacterium]|nr:hypothetical protein [Eubacteriales bacterium]MDH7565462.1 hypothetical protein [Clostridiales bacterium]